MNSKERIELENMGISEADATASAFGWGFQVDAGIFLFLYYFKDMKSLLIESKYQDIEIEFNDGHKIFAQAKSIQKNCDDNKNKKFTDALESLIKSPLSETDGDMLLYISNYGAPLLNDKEIFNNAVRKLNISTNEEAEALRLKNALVKKLETKVQSKDVKPKKKEQLKLVIERLNSFNIGNLLVSAIYPYFDAENVNEIYKVLDRNIQELLSIIFELKDSSVPKITRNLEKIGKTNFSIVLLNKIKKTTLKCRLKMIYVGT